MPHCHSAAARALRRDRAIRLGFVKLHENPGTKYVEVQRHLAPRLRAIAASLAVHDDHCRLLGRSVHFAASATACARDVVGTEAADRAMKLHKAANKAKHQGLGADLNDNDNDEDPLIANDLADPLGGERHGTAACERRTEPIAVSSVSSPVEARCGDHCADTDAEVACATDGGGSSPAAAAANGVAVPPVDCPSSSVLDVLYAKLRENNQPTVEKFTTAMDVIIAKKLDDIMMKVSGRLDAAMKRLESLEGRKPGLCVQCLPD